LVSPTLLLVALLAAALCIFALWGRTRRRRLLATVETVILRDVASAHLGNARDVVVFLPPGYRRAAGRDYSVLYLNDGQDREALGLRETLARLSARGALRPVIVVAVPTNEHRLDEYGTAAAPNAQGLGARAAAYERFMIEELMPLVAGRFRVRTPAAFLGASLGGLSAFDIVWRNPDLFDRIGVFSGSFWWRAAADATNVPPNERIAHAMVRASDYRPGFRAWFQAGTRDEVEDRDGDGVIDAIQDTLELIDELERLGYERGRDLAYVQTEGGRHDWETWARVLPDFLMWAFPPGS
jgi:enterochelin esterase-like enzyme